MMVTESFDAMLTYPESLVSPAAHGVGALVFGLIAAVTTGCGSDVVESVGASGKGEVDEASLDEDGVTVVLDGDMGTVAVPFLVPVPEVDTPARLSDALEDAVSLQVRSDVTGTTADLSSGRLIEGTPEAAGEFSWALNETRDELTLSFFNETTAGTTLKTDRSYTASLQVTSNEYVEDVPSLAISAMVVDG